MFFDCVVKHILFAFSCKLLLRCQVMQWWKAQIIKRKKRIRVEQQQTLLSLHYPPLSLLVFPVFRSNFHDLTFLSISFLSLPYSHQTELQKYVQRNGDEAEVRGTTFTVGRTLYTDDFICSTWEHYELKLLSLC